VTYTAAAKVDDGEEKTAVVAAPVYPYGAYPYAYPTAAVAAPAAITYKAAAIAPYTTYAAGVAPYTYAPYVHAPVVAKAASYYANSGGAVHIVKREAEAKPAADAEAEAQYGYYGYTPYSAAYVRPYAYSPYSYSYSPYYSGYYGVRPYYG